MDFDEFMRVFYASVEAVRSGDMAEIDLMAEGSGDLEVHITIRKEQYQTNKGNSDA